MSRPGFTIKNATLTTKDATKYHFNNNICNHIALKNRYSVLIWYRSEDYHMFFTLASYPSDDMSPPKIQEDFLRGQMEMDTMYWFTTEHLYVKSFTLIKHDDEIEFLAAGYEEDESPWALSEVNGCLGIYRLDGDVFHHVYDTYQEALQNGLKEWNAHIMGILEKNQKKG